MPVGHASASTFSRRRDFGTLDLSAFKSRIVSGLFSNGNTGDSAFLDTERFVVGSDETLDLTQTVLPSILDAATLNQLTSLATGADILSVLTPLIPTEVWDRKAANLKLGGLTELEVSHGGAITGAAGASITIPRLYNAGTIRIAGGSIVQNDTLINFGWIAACLAYATRRLAARPVRCPGRRDSRTDQRIRRKCTVLVNVTRRGERLTNGQLFSLVEPGINFDVNLVFTGRVALNEGIHLAAGSVTDLSGAALYDPRAPFLANGQQQLIGLMIGGGTIRPPVSVRRWWPPVTTVRSIRATSSSRKRAPGST